MHVAPRLNNSSRVCACGYANSRPRLPNSVAQLQALRPPHEVALYLRRAVATMTQKLRQSFLGVRTLPYVFSLALAITRSSYLQMQEGSITASGPTSMWSTFPVEESSAEPPSIRAHPVKYQYVFHRDPSVPLPLLPRESQLSAQCQWDRHLPKPDGFDQMEHDILLDRCFNFHTPWLRVVEPEYFLQDMLVQLTPISGLSATDANPRTQCYSGFLHCALMSFAAAFSDNPKIRAKSTRKLFADCAKQYLESECERPSLTVVQALTFLSDYHSSFGERGLAYLFFGLSSTSSYPSPHLIHRV